MYRVYESTEKPGVYNPVKTYQNKGHVTSKIKGIVASGKKALVVSGGKTVRFDTNGK